MLTTENTEKKKSSPRRLRVRTLVKLALLAAFIAVLIQVLQILVPAIAYRDELIALLNYSDDCKAPCFMGITPGKTTYEEAIAIVEQVGQVKFQIEYYQEHAGEITFESEKFGRLHVIFYRDIIREIYIKTKIPFAAFLLMAGFPQARKNDSTAFYPSYGLSVYPTGGCSNLYALFSGDSWLTFYSDDSEVFTYNAPYRLTFYGCVIIYPSF